MSAQPAMGTHSGSFQCDEALGIWLLRQLPKWAGAKLVRSRDKEVLDSCDIVIDVGGVYDFCALRFDHHQRGFFETFDGEVGAAKGPEEATGKFKTKLSACGLVYKHYGLEILRQLCPGMEGVKLNALYVRLYEDMFEGLDAIDNGIEVADAVRYREGTHLSARVDRLNRPWNEPAGDQAKEDARFERASALAGVEFTEQLVELVDVWLPARDQVETALLARADLDASGQILQFENAGMPWKEHLYALEREHGVEPFVKFVIFIDSSGMWRVQAVTKEGTDFTNRLSLPEAWHGLRDAKLSEVSGVADCCFCHATGFIGGNKTREGAFAMAHAALRGS